MSFGNISSLSQEVFLKAQPVKDAFNYPHTMFGYSCKIKTSTNEYFKSRFSHSLFKVLSHNFVSLQSSFLFEKLIVVRVFMNVADYYESRVALPATQQSITIFYNEFKSGKI